VQITFTPALQAMAATESEGGDTVPPEATGEDQILQDGANEAGAPADEEDPAAEPTLREQQIAIENASEAEGWYILDESGQHVGPYDVATLEGEARHGPGGRVLLELWRIPPPAPVEL
jgi:hypothetical protein